MKTFLFSYWRSIFVIIGILYLSFAPTSTFEPVPRFLHADKIVHIALYFVLTSMLIYDFSKKAKGEYRKAKLVLICLLFPISLGGIIEIFQEAFFKPRSADCFDWLADIAGVILAYLFSLFFFKHTKTKAE